MHVAMGYGGPFGVALRDAARQARRRGHRRERAARAVRRRASGRNSLKIYPGGPGFCRWWEWQRLLDMVS